MVKLLSSFIIAYKKLVSPWFAPRCRFYPSCSSYFLKALENHGACKGSALGLSRIARCHPFSEGGFDPVPGCDDKPGQNPPDREINNSTHSGTSHGY